MTQYYVGEIRLFSFGFAPRDWLPCDGAILPIRQNQALFSLLGAAYGGDGINTFGLPDLKGRAPVHAGGNVKLGESGGEEAHTLTISEMPMHVHTAKASNAAGTELTTAGNVWANTGAINSYSAKGGAVMSPNALSTAGSSQPHANMQPYTVLNYCIATTGIYPSRN